MIFVDLETSGLDPVKNGILSIGAVNYKNPSDCFYELVRLNKEKEIDPKALEINGFDKKAVRGHSRKPLYKVLNEFEKWLKQIKDITFSAHHPTFDANFLKRAYIEQEIIWPFGHRYIDLHTSAIDAYLSKGFNIPRKKGIYSVNLDNILESVGLPKRTGNHNALEDSKLEAEVHHRLVFQENWCDDFSKYDVCLRNPK